jgi:preprotein translocase subunit SecA
MLGLTKKIVGTKNERELKRMQPLVERISALEPQYEKLTNAELRAKTDEFKKRLANGLRLSLHGVERPLGAGLRLRP